MLADGWRAASLTISVCALAVIPVVLLFLRERPADVGELPYGGTPADVVPPMRTGAARLAVGDAGARRPRTRTFWLLAGGFFVCGATTTGLVQQHFMPAAHDHGMPVTTAATLLALVGVFDLVGTIGSGWLTDRFDPRILLGAYYGLRGVSLALLPPLFGADLNASVLAFVIFYGLDWVATVPPTLALTREAFGAAAPIVFGWIFASHQLGAALRRWSPASRATRWAATTPPGTAGRRCAWWARCCRCRSGGTARSHSSRPRPRPPGSARRCQESHFHVLSWHESGFPVIPGRGSGVRDLRPALDLRRRPRRRADVLRRRPHQLALLLLLEDVRDQPAVRAR